MIPTTWTSAQKKLTRKLSLSTCVTVPRRCASGTVGRAWAPAGQLQLEGSNTLSIASDWSIELSPALLTQARKFILPRF
eukprot:3935752-Rhodomonas_salina.1